MYINFYILCYTIYIYNILTLKTYIVLYTFTIDFNKIQYVQYIQASFSPGFAQQIMPYLLGTTAVLDTWTVVHITAAKFEPLIFTVWGLALFSVTNISIFMILDDFCLLPA
jgi:hypothetical protein